MAKDQQKTQKGQEIPNFTEDEARAFFELQRWPTGPACVHCGSVNAHRLQGQAHRAGLLECRDCNKQFSVTVGTVMEDSHLPLAKWAIAFHLMAASKKGVSALQLQRTLGLGSYRTAWHLAHRIREAMKREPMAAKLKGVVEVDETYIGGKPRFKHGTPKSETKKRTGRGTSKIPVVALVERDGKMHAKPLRRVDALGLKWAIRETVAKESTILTDDFRSYRGIGKEFDGGHRVVNHTAGQYVNGTDHTNTAESFFALLKRGIHGSFHHVSSKHLSRYCDEFSFRWGARKMSDTDRRDLAIKGAEGKRLMYKEPLGN
jgi:transposase-like protein